MNRPVLVVAVPVVPVVVVPLPVLVVAVPVPPVILRHAETLRIVVSPAGAQIKKK